MEAEGLPEIPLSLDLAPFFPPSVFRGKVDNENKPHCSAPANKAE